MIKILILCFVLSLFTLGAFLFIFAPIFFRTKNSDFLWMIPGVICLIVCYLLVRAILKIDV